MLTDPHRSVTGRTDPRGPVKTVGEVKVRTRSFWVDYRVVVKSDRWRHGCMDLQMVGLSTESKPRTPT